MTGHDAPATQPDTGLPPVAAVGVVCAHPDDESFGLCAIIAAVVDAGARTTLACLTRGERSTLAAGEDLAARRTAELHCAAEMLGIAHVETFGHPDGELATVALPRLVDDACCTGRQRRPPARTRGVMAVSTGPNHSTGGSVVASSTDEAMAGSRQAPARTKA